MVSEIVHLCLVGVVLVLDGGVFELILLLLGNVMSLGAADGIIDDVVADRVDVSIAGRIY